MKRRFLSQQIYPGIQQQAFNRFPHSCRFQRIWETPRDGEYPGSFAPSNSVAGHRATPRPEQPQEAAQQHSIGWNA